MTPVKVQVDRMHPHRFYATRHSIM